MKVQNRFRQIKYALDRLNRLYLYYHKASGC